VDQPQPVFYYDLGNPQCYVVAEAIMSALATVPEWEPVLGADLAAMPASPELEDRTDIGRRAGEPEDRAGIERRAAELGLQPFRWPAGWPPDTQQAMLAATYAKRIGRTVAFSLAAFRQAFAGGRDLADEDTVLIAGAACEIHPTAFRKGIALATTRTALQAATRRAQRAGATELPAIQIGDRTFTGIDALKAATTMLQTHQR
jgi:2-hydroxychromene-2-carboxylate isomerase